MYIYFANFMFALSKLNSQACPSNAVLVVAEIECIYMPLESPIASFLSIIQEKCFSSTNIKEP